MQSWDRSPPSLSPGAQLAQDNRGVASTGISPQVFQPDCRLSGLFCIHAAQPCLVGRGFTASINSLVRDHWYVPCEDTFVKEGAPRSERADDPFGGSAQLNVVRCPTPVEGGDAEQWRKLGVGGRYDHEDES